MAAKSDYAAIRVIASPEGLAVLDAKRKAIPGVLNVDIALRPGRAPVMRIGLVCGNFDVSGQAVFAIIDPQTGAPHAVKRIEFHDGSTWEAPPLPDYVVAATGEPEAAVAAASQPPTPPAKPNGGANG